MTTAPMTFDAARRRAAHRRNAQVGAGWWRSTPIDLVADAALAAADADALVARDETMTYAQLDAEVAGAVAALHDLGVAPGTPVLVAAANDVASVVAIHAVIRAGATVLLVTPSAGRAHLADVVDRCRPAVALAPATWLATSADAATGHDWRPAESLRSRATATATATAEPGPPRDPSEPSVVLFTSGTTSRPKGVVHSLDTLLAATANYVDDAQLDADDRLFLVSPMASITGVLQAITVPPVLRAPVVLEDRFDPASTLPWLLRTGATWFGGPDLLLDRVLDEADRTGVDELPLDAVYLGGTMLDPRVLDRVERRGITVMRAYGSSEAPISTAGARDDPTDLRLRDEGRPLGGVEVRIGSRDEPDECCVRGPHLFLGYVDEEDDAAAFDGEWFRTGDVAELVDGRLRIVGRLKDIVIRNGLKVGMAEVEALVATVPGVERAAAFAVPDPSTGEHLAVAVQTSRPDDISLSRVVDELKAAGLATWKLPEELVLWDEAFPETATGKVNRKLLAAGSAGRPSQRADRLPVP